MDVDLGMCNGWIFASPACARHHPSSIISPKRIYLCNIPFTLTSSMIAPHMVDWAIAAESVGVGCTWRGARFLRLESETARPWPANPKAVTATTRNGRIVKKQKNECRQLKKSE